MSENESGQEYNDGFVDAIATIAVIAVCVSSFVFWLSGQ